MLDRAAPVLVLLAALAAARVLADPRPAETPGLWAESLAAERAGRPAEAAALVERLLRDDPRQPLYLRHAALVYGQLGRRAEQAAAAELYFKTAPRPTEVCPQLAAAYEALGRPLDALEALTRCVEAAPGDPDHRYALGGSLERAGRLSEAEAHYTEAFKLAPQLMGPPLALARVWLRQGKWRAAWELLAQARRRAPDNPAVWWLSAEAARQGGDAAGEFAWQRRAETLDPRLKGRRPW